MDKYLTPRIQVSAENGDTSYMSRKLKALGALNLIGWVVAIPALMVALAGPIVAFHGWPGHLPHFFGSDTVHLGEPGESASPAHSAGRRGPGASPFASVLPGGVSGVGGVGGVGATPIAGPTGPLP